MAGNMVKQTGNTGAANSRSTTVRERFQDRKERIGRIAFGVTVGTIFTLGTAGLIINAFSNHKLPSEPPAKIVASAGALAGEPSPASAEPKLWKNTSLAEIAADRAFLEQIFPEMAESGLLNDAYRFGQLGEAYNPDLVSFIRDYLSLSAGSGDFIRGDKMYQIEQHLGFAISQLKIAYNEASPAFGSFVDAFQGTPSFASSNILIEDLGNGKRAFNIPFINTTGQHIKITNITITDATGRKYSNGLKASLPAGAKKPKDVRLKQVPSVPEFNQADTQKVMFEGPGIGETLTITITYVKGGKKFSETATLELTPGNTTGKGRVLNEVPQDWNWQPNSGYEPPVAPQEKMPDYKPGVKSTIA